METEQRLVVAGLEGEGPPAGYRILLWRVAEVLEVGSRGGCVACGMY